MDIESVTIPISNCQPKLREQCFSLLKHHFAGVNSVDFNRDWSEKDVVMLLHRDNNIVGFSTLMTMELSTVLGPVLAVFSGDTAIREECRTGFGFGRELVRYFEMVTSKKALGRPVWYILISKGWRTYRVLPVFFKDFFPQYNRLATKEEIAVANAFGASKYPDKYCYEKNIINANECDQRLQSECDMLTDRSDPHVAYFLERNPDYLNGNELVCVARVNHENYTAVPKRLLRGLAKES